MAIACTMLHSLEYELQLPRRIVFGWGRRRELGPLSRSLGRRALLVSGARSLNESGFLDELKQSLAESGVALAPIATAAGEPQLADVDQAAEVMRAAGASDGDFCLAIGGGSAIDLAKAAVALACCSQRASVKDYLEGVGRGLKITGPALPILAMPTTAGTGAEATKNAVISSYQPPFKKSLRGEQLLPHTVLVDPQLQITLPSSITAACGMDAITQLIESYLSRRATPLTQALALTGLEQAAEALSAAVTDGGNRPARERMAHAALVSGMALANSGLGFAHGVAAALGVHCRVSHGLACAVMLPAAMQVNRAVCEPELARLGELLTGRSFSSSAAAATAAIDAIEGLNREIGIPATLSQIGVTRQQIPLLVRDSRGNSMSGNPRQMSDEEITEVLEAVL
jgi:alcohol dehydrogenase class IV